MNWHSAVGNAQGRAACAIMLACVLVPAALASQSSSGSSPATNKSTPKSAPHKTAAKKKTTGSTSTKKTVARGGSATRAGSVRTYSSRKGRKVVAKRPRGQQKIDSERAEQIQSALIREHYLSGDATGTWNQASEDAMRHYQSDHGWQTKEVPDSRALIKLGLGPSNDHLLNPQSAMTMTSSAAPKSASLPTTSQGPLPVSSPAGTGTPSQGNSSQPQK